jgi:hypothetical protein
MKARNLAVFVLTVASTLAAVPAGANSTVLYDNTTSSSYQTYAFNISPDWVVSDSFSLSNASLVNGATFALWIPPGDSLTSVDWSISPNSGQGNFPSGTATSFITTLAPAPSWIFSIYGVDIDLETITFPNVNLAAGTYWFELGYATTALGNNVYWDASIGPSSATQSVYFDGVDYFEESLWESQTFQIDGSTAATPEPGSFMLLGTGLIGLAGLVRRKRKA